MGSIHAFTLDEQLSANHPRASPGTLNGNSNAGTTNCHALGRSPRSNGGGLVPLQDAGSSAEPLVIVGLGMRLPGNIHRADELWKMLTEKGTTRCEVPASRFNVAGFHSPSGKVGSVAMQHGHFLAETDDLRHLDTSFFSMGRKEVDQLDPQQRMLLEVVYECMQNAGQVNWRGEKIGCYVGVWGEDWIDLHAKDAQDAGMYRIPGGHDFAISNRISYEYDLRGPSFTIKAGCSSSMIALHEAVRAIKAGDCSSAIVAGTNLIMSPTMTIAMTEQGVLSPDGSCKTFDATANGYARGEAINAIYIKPMSQARRSNDPIRAVIRGTATNFDGKTPGMSMPSSEGHETLMRRAYSEAALDPTQTAFVEAHGTGTPVGDPLEANAIARVFGGGDGGNRGTVYVGSVKPNLGHSEGASGISSIIKTVLALENLVIPPNINYATPNPKIPFREANMAVPVEPLAWPRDKAWRASVNSFGIGGANAHVILERAGAAAAAADSLSPDIYINNKGKGRSKRRFFLHVLSAASPESLRHGLVEHQQYIQANPSRMQDISYTLCCRREHLAHRAFGLTDQTQTGESRESLQWSPLTKAKKRPSLTMVFTGQGAQWAGMARELMEDYESFNHDILVLGSILATQLEHPPSWDLKDELLKPEPESNLSQAECAQPLATAVQIALVNLLRRWGILPDAVVGHSSGEIGAAYAAGALTAKEAITIAYYRGYVTKGFSRPGGMAAIGAGREEVTPFLRPGVVIACENSPQSVTISGDKEILEEVCREIKTELPDRLVRLLKVGMAYHSHHMLEVGQSLEDLLHQKLHSKAPSVPFFSSAKAKYLGEPACLNGAYWRENFEKPVLFHSAVKLLLDTQSSKEQQLFLEIGPHSALAGPLRQISKAHGRSTDGYVPTLIRGEDCTKSLLKMAGELYLQNIPIDFSHIAPAGNVVMDLPLYQWRHDQEYWAESRVSRAWRCRQFPHHELLGSRTMEGHDLQPEWRNVLRLEDVPWLRDHQIVQDVVFPCAGYLAMAGEAIQQISSAEDFTFGNVVVQTALVLSDSKPVEMITSLRPARLTTTLNSAWWDFTVISYNGNMWIKHCTGQVRPGMDCSLPPPPATTTIGKHPRMVHNLYPALRKVGLNYGPAFQGLRGVSVLPNRMTASAELSKTVQSESRYAVHPTVIDQCLQLFFPASSEGIHRRVEKLCVPTGLEQLYVAGGKNYDGAAVEAVAKTTSSGAISGDLVAVGKGTGIILSLFGGKFSPLEVDSSSDEEDSSDRIAGAQLEWKCHLDHVDLHSLVRSSVVPEADLERVEKLTLLSIIEIGRRISNIDINASVPAGHLHKFGSWIQSQISRPLADKYDLVPNALDLVALAPETRISLITELHHEALQTSAAPAAELISRVLGRCEEIVRGEVDGIEVLQPDDGLTNFYTFLDSRTDSADFFAAAGHTRPTLRVLEIGAGTGGGTATILKSLNSSSGAGRGRMYSTYTYTDVSAGFFVAAQARFQEYSNIEFKVLDVTKDPVEQGFQAESYDLIIAANVLHATPSLRATLTNVRKLLAPDGYLFLQELTPRVQMVNLIMGILPGWWLGEADGRVDSPYVAPGQWDIALKATGFSGVDAAIYDAPQPYTLNANLISRPKQADLRRSSGRVTLLHHHQENGASQHIAKVKEALTESGLEVDLCSFRDDAPHPTVGQDIISVLEVENPIFEALSAIDLAAFQSIVKNLGTNKMLWVTRPGQQDISSSPGFGLSLGLTRTLRSEHLVAISTLEVDAVDDRAYRSIAKLFNKLRSSKSSSEGGIDPDAEFRLVDGVLNVGRYHPTDVANDLALTNRPAQAVKLEIGRRGLLQTLHWAPFKTTNSNPGPGEVVIEPRCVGLNFRDVLLSMGIVEGGLGIGLEGSGIVAAVGSEATNVEVGDRVFYLDDNCFSTRLTMSAMRCSKIPDNLSFEEAATMPCVYSTVIHSLLDVGRMEKGQSVLIHSACGGIGLAAINVCQSFGGIEIYVTVGSSEKVQYLMETFGIARDHIFNSRDNSFLPAIKNATSGRGVDLVLNSLSGELLHASWQCVAPYGKMLEIGKRDFIGKAQLNMDLFEANRSFLGIDLARFDADRCQPLLARTAQFFESGAIKPISPIKTFSADRVEDSFRYMQKGTHLGKIVVTIPQGGEGLAVAAAAPELQLNPEASYVLVGGLGGLGRAVATWMIEKGAKNLIFFSRSAGRSEKDQAFFRELESQGCSVQAVTGSVMNLEDVERVAKTAARPIKGVLQMSMVLRDMPFLDMTISDWEAAVAPKVQGTWNLHRAMPRDLDFFFAAGSLSGSFGTPGQANYAAANTFLNAFVQYRKHLGLPASILHIGMMGDIGYLAEATAKAEALRAAGGYTLGEKELLDSLHWAIVKSAAEHRVGQLTIGLRSGKPLSDPSNRIVWKSDRRMGVYYNHGTSTSPGAMSSSETDRLRSFMASVEADPSLLDQKSSLDLVATEIGIKTYTFMLQPVEDLDVSVSLSSLGVDSLVTIEIRNWMKRSFGGVEFSTLEILNAGSILGLGTLVIETLKGKIASRSTENMEKYLGMKAP